MNSLLTEEEVARGIILATVWIGIAFIVTTVVYMFTLSPIIVGAVIGLLIWVGAFLWAVVTLYPGPRSGGGGG